MTKRVRIIGIGTGNPEHLTREATEALSTIDVFLVPDQEDSRPDPDSVGEAVSAEVIAELIRASTPPPTPQSTRAGRTYRVVEVTHPERGPDRARDPAAYDQEVGDGHPARVDSYGDALATLAPHEETVGILVWGDPALFDSTIRLVDALAERLRAEVEVIPGISAPQLLAARHHISLSRAGGPIHITTGARLLEEYDPALGDVVVLFDGHLRCLELAPLHPDLEIHWGAHLGTADEVLVAGRLGEVEDELRAAWDRAREARGRVQDTYLLRLAPDAVVAVPTPWPPVESLSDGVVVLRPLELDDWPHLLAEHNDADSIRWAFTTELMTEPAARQAAARARRDWATGRAARFVVVDAVTGRSAGQISVIRMGPPDVGLIGYGVLPDFRGRGYTTRALELLVAWVFETTSIGRLELGHKVGNVASGVVASRAGFVREGVLAGRLINADGTFSDEVSYARLRP